MTTKSIEINEDIYERIQKKVNGSNEFSSVEEFVNFVLEEVVKKQGDYKDRGLSKEDEDKVKERLENLGYLG